MVNSELNDKAHIILSKTKRYLQIVRGRKNATLSDAVVFLYNGLGSEDIKDKIEERAYVRRQLKSREVY